MSWFAVLDKQPVDRTYSAMVVEAAPLEPRSGAAKPAPAHDRGQIGVFVAYEKSNQVYMVIDTYPMRDLYPQLEKPTRTAIHLHFIADYGLY